MILEKGTIVKQTKWYYNWIIDRAPECCYRIKKNKDIVILMKVSAIRRVKHLNILKFRLLS